MLRINSMVMSFAAGLFLALAIFHGARTDSLSVGLAVGTFVCLILAIASAVADSEG